MYSQAALGPSSIYLYESYWFVWFRTTGSECAISTDDKVGCNGKRTSGTTESRIEAGDFLWSIVMSRFVLRACVLMDLNENTCSHTDSFYIERETL